jgi:4-hydroxy-3-methylbut-2-enyl diphosphate reductase
MNTVCPVTIRRQQDSMELADQVDMMVVVGGRNSANTKELTRLCEIAGKPAIQIESARDLNSAEPFANAQIVGVTGGTSTPIEDLEKVAQRIYELGGTDERRAEAERLAHAALTAVAEPAYRSSSLDNQSRAKRRPPRTPVAGAA